MTRVIRTTLSTIALVAALTVVASVPANHAHANDTQGFGVIDVTAKTSCTLTAAPAWSSYKIGSPRDGFALYDVIAESASRAAANGHTFVATRADVQALIEVLGKRDHPTHQSHGGIVPHVRARRVLRSGCSYSAGGYSWSFATAYNNGSGGTAYGNVSLSLDYSVNTSSCGVYNINDSIDYINGAASAKLGPALLGNPHIYDTDSAFGSGCEALPRDGVSFTGATSTTGTSDTAYYYIAHQSSPTCQTNSYATAIESFQY